MTDKKYLTKENLLITSKDCSNIFDGFKNDKERIKYMSHAYRNMNIAKAFGVFYGFDVDNDVKHNKNVNSVYSIEIGQVYSANVKQFDKNTLTFDIPGVKEEIIAKDNFSTCVDEINAYLLTHNNKLMFEVREKKHDKYIVSVTQAYYKAWVNKINKAIENKHGIHVHIDELVKGGYVCHTNIDELIELTGKNYTHSVFIPGSQIVLNIERDFEKWVGEDVIVVPQKFMDFQTIGYGANQLTEKSLVSSRKLVLQILGMKSMYEIYNDEMSKKKLAESNANVKFEKTVFEGTVTGIIYSSKKTGIFVELNDKYITGLMPTNSLDLANYKPGDKINVRISEFEVQEGKEPFVLNKKGTSILKCNVRPVFEKV